MATGQGSLNFSIMARDAASKTIRGIGVGLKGMAKTSVAAFAAFTAAATTAAAAAVAFAKKAINAAIEDAAAQDHMISLLKKRKMWNDKTRASIDAMIVSGQELAFTDDDIRGAMETATQYTKKFGDATKILAAAQNIARAKHMDLASATQMVGRGYMGMTRGLKMLGVEIPKGATGLTVLNAIMAKYGGSAQDYSKTFKGQMESVNIAVQETIESIGYALGGGEGLPTLTKLLAGLRPTIDDILGTVKENLPALQQYAAKIASEIPGKVARLWKTIKTNLPDIKRTIQTWIDKAMEFGHWLSKHLGAKGAASLGLSALALKIGGWKAAIATAFAQGFASIGWDPLTSAIGGAIAAGIASAAVEVAIKALTLKMAAALAGQTVVTSVAGGVAAAGATAAASGVGAATAAGGAAAGAAGAAGVVGGFSAATVASAIALPFALAAGLKALGVNHIAMSGMPSDWGPNGPNKPKPANAFGAYSNPMDAKYSSIYTNVELSMDGKTLATIIDKRIAAGRGQPRTNPGRNP